MKLPGHSKNHGGARAGSGRPKQIKNYSEEIKKDFLKAAKTKAKETGQTLGQVVVGLIYNENIQDSVRLAAIKVWTEVIVKESKHSEDQRPIGPTIGLPPIMSRPDERVGIYLPEVKPVPPFEPQEVRPERKH